MKLIINIFIGEVKGKPKGLKSQHEKTNLFPGVLPRYFVFTKMQKKLNKSGLLGHHPLTIPYFR